MELKKILYLAKAKDLSSDEFLTSKKIGVTADLVNRRITQLNSTKMPIAVELEIAWSFERSKIDAYKAEQAAHALLASSRVNGEWFKDEQDELADNLGLFVHHLGGELLELSSAGDSELENQLVEASKRSTRELRKMQSVFEPARAELKELGIDWEYMTYKVGMTTKFGRINISVRAKQSLYLVLKSRELQLEKLVTSMQGIPWRNGESDGHFLANDVSISGLLSSLK